MWTNPPINRTPERQAKHLTDLAHAWRYDAGLEHAIELDGKGVEISASVRTQIGYYRQGKAAAEQLGMNTSAPEGN